MIDEYNKEVSKKDVAHRARLVQIPVEIVDFNKNKSIEQFTDNDYLTSLYKNNYINNNESFSNNCNSENYFRKQNFSPNLEEFESNSENRPVFISTNQYKFPRKNSNSNFESTINKSNSSILDNYENCSSLPSSKSNSSLYENKTIRVLPVYHSSPIDEKRQLSPQTSSSSFKSSLFKNSISPSRTVILNGIKPANMDFNFETNTEEKEPINIKKNNRFNHKNDTASDLNCLFYFFLFLYIFLKFFSIFFF